MIMLDKAGVEGSGFQYTYKCFLKSPILNHKEITDWYARKGLKLENPEDMCVEIAYTDKPLMDKSFVLPDNRDLSNSYRRLENDGEDIYLKLQNKDLEERQKKLQASGTGWKWDQYHPRIKLGKAKDQPTIPLDSIGEYPGNIWTGPEGYYGDIWENYEAEEKSELEPIIMYLPTIIKAGVENGQRIVEVEASCEKVDLEGDIILQKALLDSSKSFIQNGHLDIDHKSEPPVARRLGITNPTYYIVGRPLEVRDGGGKRTFVKGEISKSLDGSFDARNRTYDMFWDSLNRSPPVTWYSSVYGMPIERLTKNCRMGGCNSEARRWLIEGLEWKSLAFTQHPVNNALKGKACVLTAKAFFDHIKGEPVLGEEPTSAYSSSSMPTSPTPTVGGVMMKGHSCPSCGPILQKAPSVAAWKRHLMKCEMVDEGLAEIYSLAMLYDRLLKNIGVK